MRGGIIEATRLDPHVSGLTITHRASLKVVASSKSSIDDGAVEDQRFSAYA